MADLSKLRTKNTYKASEYVNLSLKVQGRKPSPSVLEKLAQMAIIVACLQCYTWIWKTAGHAKQISGKRREIEDLLRNTQ
jgi:hypothetical protein